MTRFCQNWRSIPPQKIIGALLVFTYLYAMDVRLWSVAKNSPENSMTIKLISTAQYPPITLLFQKESMIIGDEECQPDLVVQDTMGLTLEVEISEKNNQFFVSNHTGHPEVTLNGFYISSSTINNGDYLQVGTSEFRFIGELSSLSSCRDTPPSSPHSFPWIDTSHRLRLLLDQFFDALHAQSGLLIQKTTLEKEKTLFSELSKDSFGKNRAQNRLELSSSFFAEKESSSPPPPLWQPHAITRLPGNHLFDKQPVEPHQQSFGKVQRKRVEEALPELRQESYPREPTNTFRRKNPFFWKIVLGMAAGFFLLSLFFSIYLKAFREHRSAEAEAARKVSDLAMAILYADLHQLHPQRYDWGDQRFLQKIYDKLLPFRHAPERTEERKETRRLRIYTGREAKSFLIMAQPNPTFLGGLFPTVALVVHSSDMIVRRVHPLKQLNQLLAELRLKNREEEERLLRAFLVKQERYPLYEIPLYCLEGTGFCRGAASEQFPTYPSLYQLPRYQSYGRAFLDKILEWTRLQQKSEFLSEPFTDMVYYLQASQEEFDHLQEIWKELYPESQSLLLGPVIN